MAVNPLTVAGLGFEALGTISEYQADVSASKYNENLARENAEIVLKVGAERERKQRVLGAQALGDIKSSYAASGVTLEGSALDVLEFSAANAELDALTIKWESESEARGLRNKAALERSKRSTMGIQNTLGLLSLGFKAGGKKEA